MSSNNEDINLRTTRDASEEEVHRANVTHQRPHHCHPQDGGLTARLTAEVAQMAASMRNIVALNAAVHKLLMQVQGQ